MPFDDGVIGVGDDDGSGDDETLLLLRLFDFVIGELSGEFSCVSGDGGGKHNLSIAEVTSFLVLSFFNGLGGVGKLVAAKGNSKMTKH